MRVAVFNHHHEHALRIALRSQPESPLEAPPGSAVRISSRPADLELVRVAQAGELDAVRAALAGGVTDVNVRVRCVQGKRLKGRPVSALHAAAASGAADVVEVLLEHGASPRACNELMRPLTPLHLAATAHVAQLLLVAGAQPICLDPREPELVWYHMQHGRTDVADVIAQWKRAQTARENGRHTAMRPATHDGGHGQPAPSAARRTAVPAASAAELRDALERWRLPALQARSLITGDGDADPSCHCRASTAPQVGRARALSKRTRARAGSATSIPALFRDAAGDATVGGDTDGDASLGASVCSICLIAMEPTDELMALPCAPAHAAHSHVWHAACLCRWLQHKRSCPVCRHDVLSLLRAPEKSSKPARTTPPKLCKHLATDEDLFVAAPQRSDFNAGSPLPHFGPFTTRIHSTHAELTTPFRSASD
jgi:hypothetical protein